MKNIGILTYHSVCNFGANLQALSTVGFFRRKGYNPMVIDWVPDAVDSQYRKSILPEQYAEHEKFVSEYLPLTSRCRTEQDIVEQIKNHNIDAVVIGSDAVAQHKSFWARINFPTRKIVTVSPEPPAHLIYPNPFWGSFSNSLDKKIPVILMSVSSQNEKYYGIQGQVRSEMANSISEFAYVSVRDNWTQAMFKHITCGKIVPPVTPDPVFSFNQNAGELILSKEDILNKYSISEDYLLISFIRKSSVDEKWIAEFVKLARAKKLECLIMPMPKGHIFRDIPGARKIDLPLPPLDWYGLIKNSSAYIGHNMHPMVVSMHNNVPYYIFDYYGVIYLRGFVNSKSSKIYHIINKAGMLSQRSRDAGFLCELPRPSDVLESVLHLKSNRHLLSEFSTSIQVEYETMMADIVSVIENGI